MQRLLRLEETSLNHTECSKALHSMRGGGLAISPHLYSNNGNMANATRSAYLFLQQQQQPPDLDLHRVCVLCSMTTAAAAACVRAKHNKRSPPARL